MPVFWSQTSQYYSSMKLGNILKDSNLRTQTKETFNQETPQVDEDGQLPVAAAETTQFLLLT